jgi:hypothetical protein
LTGTLPVNPDPARLFGTTLLRSAFGVSDAPYAEDDHSDCELELNDSGHQPTHVATSTGERCAARGVMKDRLAASMPVRLETLEVFDVEAMLTDLGSETRSAASNGRG